MADSDHSKGAKPRRVSEHLWEKFKALERRVEDTTKRSTERRIKLLQKAALENVSQALAHSDDRNIIGLPEGLDVSPEPSSSVAGSSTSGARKRKVAALDEDSSQHRKDCDAGDDESEGQWSKVQKLFGVNAHLAGVSHGSLGPKTVLELRMEEAVAAGDLQKAEELSDQMATREFGEKVTQAIDAKNFLELKKKEEEAAKAKKKKKLHWGFEPKQRWETKSNM